MNKYLLAAILGLEVFGFQEGDPFLHILFIVLTWKLHKHLKKAKQLPQFSDNPDAYLPSDPITNYRGIAA